MQTKLGAIVEKRTNGKGETEIVSAELAAKRLGHTQGYVTRLLRNGKLVGRKISERSWVTTDDAIRKYRREVQKKKSRGRPSQGEVSGGSPGRRTKQHQGN